MICRLTGRLTEIGEDSAVLETGGLGYEVLLPALALTELSQRRGEELTLFTLQHFEGNPAGSHLVPRLIGFLTAGDRDFFRLFTRVKGISFRRALRAMCLPVPQIAAAIESGDARLLTSLPEIGKKTAAQVVAELQGKLQAFVVAAEPTRPAAVLNDAQRIAVEILVQWGDRRADAQRWVAAAVEAEPHLVKPEDIVRAAYRHKEARA